MKDRSALRLATLQEALASGGTLHLRDAAELCGVSEMTIRRDVNAHPQVISLLGGRLVMAHTPGVTPVYDLTEQQASHYQAKSRLCQRARRFIEEGDTLFIDCGSTLMPLMNQLSEFRELTVITYALNVANAVAVLPNVRLVMLGGLFYPTSQSFASDTMAESIERLGINKAFISAAGVDLQRGVSCFHFHEVVPKQAAMAAAMQRLLVVDASKFGVVRPAYFASVNEFDVVVTDDDDAPALLRDEHSGQPTITAP
ncbi:DeoR/GlpR family DNA-binding transcription regulator [Vreelandella arcis]|uniref:Transcriptional regulator, DeoR family n=1 Tax=Vreelandella arcis TaxID=416873 RepID=A0A1H0GV76_9GAMM|nr:DeoR/GlpR family DNA-binding transcription regulator [Halomonas arcis]SDO10787.1 transcriptional regulator, DeoR family [Halomonas arcis]